MVDKRRWTPPVLHMLGSAGAAGTGTGMGTGTYAETITGPGRGGMTKSFAAVESTAPTTIGSMFAGPGVAAGAS